jgi:AraC-like DNA-binding protein
MAILCYSEDMLDMALLQKTSRNSSPILPAGTKPIQLHFEEYSRGLPYVIKWDRSKVRREPHVHDFHEIAIITRGVGHHRTEYSSWSVQAGDVLTIGGKHVHCYEDVHDLELVNILYRGEPSFFKDPGLRQLDGFHALFGAPHVRPKARLERHFRLSSKDLDAVLATVAAMEQELKNPHPGSIYMAGVHFMALVGSLSRFYSQQSNSDTKSVARLAKAINHMEGRFRDEVRLEEVARVAGMSPRQLQRLFHLATGDAPLAYLRKFRLMQAAAALRDPRNRVTEVAFASGFNDSNYFSRQFQKLFGASPRAYRRRGGA